MKDRIKEIRKSLDLTQQEFADKLGIKRNTVATYEAGKSTPSDAAVSLICNKCGVNENWLRTGKGDPYIKVDRDIALMEWAGTVLGETDESFRKRFINMLSKLDEKDWVTLEKIVLLLEKEEQ